MKTKKKIIIIFIVLALFCWSAFIGFGTTKNYKSISVTKTNEWYLLDLNIKKRYWKLITPEGVFPSESLHYKLKVQGDGKDWSFRSQEGYFYSLDNISTNMRDWDLGYVWTDKHRKYIYVNLFWVKAPDKLIPADVNGKYEVSSSGGRDD